MGIVRKQSILSLISIYAGFSIGALNQYLYIHNLSQDEYGLTSMFREVFIALSVFASLGSLLTFHRFYPIYSNFLSKERNDLPFLIIGACLIGLALIVGSLFLFKDLIIKKYSENSPLFVDWFYLLLPLTGTYLCLILFEAFAMMLRRTVGANLIREVGFRAFQTVIILLYSFEIISIDVFFILFSLMYVPAVIVMAGITFARNGIRITSKISALTKRIYKIMLGYTFFHFGGAAVAALPIAINMSIISSVSANGLGDAGVYALARYFVSIIEVPLRSMTGINIATISEATHKKDISKIARIYQKSSISLFVIGIALFILIATNVDVVNTTLFNTADKNYSLLPQIFFIIGLSKVLELSMGLNNVILYLSKFWKIELFITSSVVILNIPVSYYLTKHYGIVGTAFSEALVLSLYCLLRFYWVKKLIGIQPYTHKSLGMLLIGVICFILTWLIPDMEQPILNHGIKVVFFCAIYALAVWYYNPSEDIKDMMVKVKQKIWR